MSQTGWRDNLLDEMPSVSSTGSRLLELNIYGFDFIYVLHMWQKIEMVYVTQSGAQLHNDSFSKQ